MTTCNKYLHFVFWAHRGFKMNPDPDPGFYLNDYGPREPNQCKSMRVPDPDQDLPSE
jgi:hypothetical protein